MAEEQTLFNLYRQKGVSIQGSPFNDLQEKLGIRFPGQLVEWLEDPAHSWKKLIKETKLTPAGAEVLSNILIADGYDVPAYQQAVSATRIVATEIGTHVKLSLLRVQLLDVLMKEPGRRFTKYEVGAILGRKSGPVLRNLRFLVKMNVKGIRSDETKGVFWYEGEPLSEETVEVTGVVLPDLEEFAYPPALTLLQKAAEHLERAKAIEETIAGLQRNRRAQLAFAKKAIDAAYDAEELAEVVEEFGGKLRYVEE